MEINAEGIMIPIICASLTQSVILVVYVEVDRQHLPLLLKKLDIFRQEIELAERPRISFLGVQTGMNPMEESQQSTVHISNVDPKNELSISIPSVHHHLSKPPSTGPTMDRKKIVREIEIDIKPQPCNKLDLSNKQISDADSVVLHHSSLTESTTLGPEPVPSSDLRNNESRSNLDDAMKPGSGSGDQENKGTTRWV